MYAYRYVHFSDLEYLPQINIYNSSYHFDEIWILMKVIFFTHHSRDTKLAISEKNVFRFPYVFFSGVKLRRSNVVAETEIYFGANMS